MLQQICFVVYNSRLRFKRVVYIATKNKLLQSLRFGSKKIIEKNEKNGRMQRPEALPVHSFILFSHVFSPFFVLTVFSLFFFDRAGDIVRPQHMFIFYNNIV